MMSWLEAHGFECLVAAYLFSGATSVMPPLPSGVNWFVTWAYGVLQVFGANLGSIAKHTPTGARMEAVLGKEVYTEANGAKTTTEITKISEAPKP